jgi:DNA-binding CsgD family transcriptional regulator/catechol 2,3-dioxygenase-like lactoylglutathione lyase family enzyme
MTRKRGRPPHDDLLTPAEWRTVNFVRHGLTNAQIAERQGVSLDAIKYHVANAVAKLGVANRKALKTWSGSPKDSMTRAGVMAMNDDLHFLGLGQVARSATDIKSAESWYRDVLGLDHLFTFGNLAFFDCGGTRLMVSEAEDAPGNESLLYLRVPDIHAAYERLQEAGVTFINAPHMLHKHDDGVEEWMAFFNDPDDRPLAIMATTAPTEDQPG